MSKLTNHINSQKSKRLEFINNLKKLYESKKIEFDGEELDGIIGVLYEKIYYHDASSDAYKDVPNNWIPFNDEDLIYEYIDTDDEIEYDDVFPAVDKDDEEEYDKILSELKGLLRDFFYIEYESEKEEKSDSKDHVRNFHGVKNNYFGVKKKKYELYSWS